MTLVMGRWEARVVLERALDSERKSDPSPFGDLLSVRLVLMSST